MLWQLESFRSCVAHFLLDKEARAKGAVRNQVVCGLETRTSLTCTRSSIDMHTLADRQA